jgi:hypothetical protein
MSRRREPRPAGAGDRLRRLAGSPDLICEKVEGLGKIGVDHACAR